MRCKNDFKNSSLVEGLALNSDMSRDKSELYTLLGPLVVVVGPPPPPADPTGPPESTKYDRPSYPPIPCGCGCC